MKCIIVDDDLLSGTMLKNFVQETPYLQLVGFYSSAVEAAGVLRQQNVELIFLDIEMPQMSGIEFLKILHYKPHIILVTGNDKYALEAFEYEVADYITKPATYARFLKAVNKVLKDKNEGDKVIPNDQYLFVKINSTLTRISLQDILYVEALGDYVSIVTLSKNYTVYTTLKGLESKLPENDFIRVHRSFIARIDKITAVDDYTLVIDKKTIPISKTYKDDLISRLNLI